MAFASPDPKRVEADKARIRQRHLDDVAEIQRRKREARENERVASEIRDCYREHTPRQVALAMKDDDGGPGMIACGAVALEREKALLASRESGEVCWERIGESRGGKRRKNLYRCTVVA